MNIEDRVVKQLKENKMLLTTAESCTGGLVAASIVNVSGASEVFHQGYITYCDDAKNSILCVEKEILDKYKAVSPQVACKMALGALDIANADISVSVTGVAGPSTEDGKPVGLVYIGVASRTGSDYSDTFNEDNIVRNIADLTKISKNGEVLYKTQEGYTVIKENRFDGDRSTIRNKACMEALNMICTYVEGIHKN